MVNLGVRLTFGLLDFLIFGVRLSDSYTLRIYAARQATPKPIIINYCLEALEFRYLESISKSVGKL